MNPMVAQQILDEIEPSTADPLGSRATTLRAIASYLLKREY